MKSLPAKATTPVFSENTTESTMQKSAWNRRREYFKELMRARRQDEGQTLCYLPAARYQMPGMGSTLRILSLARFNSVAAATEAASDILKKLEEERRRVTQIPGAQIGKPWPETEAAAYPAWIRRSVDGTEVIAPDYDLAKSDERAG